MLPTSPSADRWIILVTRSNIGETSPRPWFGVTGSDEGRVCNDNVSGSETLEYDRVAALLQPHYLYHITVLVALSCTPGYKHNTGRIFVIVDRREAEIEGASTC